MTRLRLLPTAHPANAAGGVGSAISLALHALVGVLVALGPSAAEHLESFSEPLPDGLTFLVPPSTRPEEPVTALQFQEAGTRAGDDAGAAEREGGGPFVDRPRGEDSLSSAVGNPNDGREPAVESTMTIPADVFMLVEVDSAATRHPESAAPVYPPAMLQRQLEGYVTVRFIVDTTGRVDLASVQVLLASRPEFSRAVREALPGMRFTPARMGATPVRQLAEQMFRFQLPQRIP